MKLEDIEWEKYVYYDPKSPSCLRWLDGKESGRGITARKHGDVAGTFDKSQGYFRLRFRCKSFLVHRIIIALHGIKINDNIHVDHLNRDRGDNRIENLNACFPNENMLNKSKYANNKTGTTGVIRRYISKHGYGYYYYIANWYEEGKSQSKAFSCNKYGEDEAKRLATEFRRNKIESLGIFSETHGG